MFMLNVLALIIHAQRSKAKQSFRTLTLVLVNAIVVSCVNYYFKMTVLAERFPTVTFALYMINFFTNIVVIFYLMRYIEGFFGESYSPKGAIKKVNLGLFISSGVILFLMFILKLSGAIPEESFMAVFNAAKGFFVYLLEVYFLVYTLIFFMRHKNKRANPDWDWLCYDRQMLRVSIPTNLVRSQ